MLINCSRNIHIFIGDLSRAFSFYFGRLICRHTTNSTSSICVSICSSFFLYDAWLRSFLETTWLWCHVIYGPIYKSLYRFVLKKLFWVLQFWHPRRSISRFPCDRSLRSQSESIAQDLILLAKSSKVCKEEAWIVNHWLAKIPMVIFPEYSLLIMFRLNV